MRHFDQLKQGVTHFIISVLVVYATIIAYFAFSHFMSMQGSLEQSRIQISIDALRSGHFIGEIQKSPSGISFRWVDSRIRVKIPKFINSSSIVSFTTWLHPIADTLQDGPYHIVSIDETVFTTHSNVFVPRTYQVLTLPMVFTESNTYLSIPYVFTSDTPYWAYSGVTVEQVAIKSIETTELVSLYVLLMLVIPIAYSSVCWFTTKHVHFSLAVGLGVALILAVRTVSDENYVVTVLQGIVSKRHFLAAISTLMVALTISLHHWLSPFWQNIKRILHIYIPVIHTRWFVGTASTLAVVYGAITWLSMISETGTWHDQIVHANQMMMNGTTVGHVFFQTLLIVVHCLSLGLLPLEYVAIFLVVLAVLLMCVLIWNISAYLWVRPQPYHLVASVLFFCVFAPFTIFAFHLDGRSYTGDFVSHIFHNPMVVTILPFAIIHFVLLVHFFTQQQHDNDVILWGVLWGVTFFGVFANTNYLIMMLPAQGLLVIWRRIHQHAQSRRDFVTFVVCLSAYLFPVFLQFLLHEYSAHTYTFGIQSFDMMIDNDILCKNGVHPFWMCALTNYSIFGLKGLAFLWPFVVYAHNNRSETLSEHRLFSKTHNHFKRLGKCISQQHSLFFGIGVASIPVVIGAMLLRVFGGSYAQLRPSLSESDEFGYWLQGRAWHVAQFDSGYFTWFEQTASFSWSHYYSWGIFIAMFYGMLDIDFLYNRVVLTNIIFFVACCVAAAVIAKWKWRESLFIGFVVAIFPAIVLYLPSSMQELAHFGIATLLAALFYRQLEGDHNIRSLTVGVIVLAMLLRPTWGLLLVPAMVIDTNKKTWSSNSIRVLVSCAIFAVVAFLFFGTAAPFPSVFRAQLFGDINGVSDGLSRVWNYLNVNLGMFSSTQYPTVWFQRTLVQILLLGIIAEWIQGLRNKQMLVWNSDRFIHIWNVLGMFAVLAFLYEFTANREFRAYAPHLLFSILLMVQRRQKFLTYLICIWCVLSIQATWFEYAIQAPSRLTSPARPYPEFTQVLEYSRESPAWCNTIGLYWEGTNERLYVSIPAGFGVTLYDELGIVNKKPSGVGYMFLSNSMLNKSEKMQLTPLVTTADGVLFRNEAAHCPSYP